MFFLLLSQLSRRTLRGNACHAGYNAQNFPTQILIWRPIFSDHNHLLRWRPFCRSSSNEWRWRLHLMGSCFLLLLFTPLESNQLTHVLIPGGMKGAGCSSSRRGVNFGLWCHLGCSRQNAIIFCRKGLYQGCKRRNIYKKYFQFVLFTRFM